MKQVALDSPKIKAQIEGKTIVKTIVVPVKVVNIVVKLIIGRIYPPFFMLKFEL